ncbi:hypothetical protein NLG97_g2677 [Lecanicillium saksenae]|uniref:Uncharacterized protein n=1 Tax=Lecanicillium saksenae TaxID=468837 RepID=A0ACC1R2W0_9HYPO|nr:hypothetical protein NLG97_g2677 [Lecanicillium saksenae]
MGGALERALPMAMAIFCGVAGGFYTFQPMLAPKEPLDKLDEATKPVNAKTTDAKAPDAKVGVTKPAP